MPLAHWLGPRLLGAAPGMASTTFNRALGIAERPDLLGVALAFFVEHRVEGDVTLDPVDLPMGIEPRVRLDIHIGNPHDTESVTVGYLRY